jgi:hypothetical protein
MRVAYSGHMNKQSKANAKPPAQGSHPETRQPRPKSGTPGTESSKAKGAAKDARNTHDKDGNSQQRAR